MSYGFKQSLAQGQVGEIIFHAANKDAVIRLDGFKSDFQLHTGEGIELKCDQWAMSKTPNYFFERYSNEAKQSPGGPWQSLANGSCLFVYMYVKDLTYFVFDNKKLVERLEVIIPSIKPFPIENQNYTTIGYRVPREAVADLATEFVITCSSEPKEKS